MAESKLTQDMVDRLVPHLEAGEFLEIACDLEGVHPVTVHRWLSSGAEASPEAAELVARLARARAEGERAILRRIEKKTAMRRLDPDDPVHPGDWKADAWKLERLRPSRYRETTRTELTGAEGGPVEVAQVAAQVRERLRRLADAAELPALPALPEGAVKR